jgi:hypothetical protein
LENFDEVRQGFKDADYALFLKSDQDKPIMLVEAKPLGENLDKKKYAKQVMGYVGWLGAGWAVLTNGDEYRVYNGTGGAMDIKEKLFRTVRVTDPDAQAAEALALLSRGNIGDLQKHWDEELADRQVRQAANSLFSPTPDSRLVDLVKEKVNGLAPFLGPEQIRASLSRIHRLHLFGRGTPVIVFPKERVKL